MNLLSKTRSSTHSRLGLEVGAIVGDAVGLPVVGLMLVGLPLGCPLATVGACVGNRDGLSVVGI